MSLEQTNRESLLHGVSINTNGKLIWRDNRILAEIVEEV